MKGIIRNKEIVFIVSSGRSGTFSIVNALRDQVNLEIYHEYLFELILKNAVLFKMGLINENEIIQILVDTYGSSIFYSRAKVWIDCSNALPWIIKPLNTVFPNAKFVHLIRDGRKVVSSFYFKFGPLMYSDECISDMLNWFNHKDKYPIPPAEKKYWRPIPIYDKKMFNKFLSYDQFQRICFYWNELNQHILDEFMCIPNTQKLTIKFEDLLIKETEQRKFSDFIGLKFTKEIFQSFSRPVNVYEPQNYILNKDQLKKFRDICWPLMVNFDYSKSEEYCVKY